MIIVGLLLYWPHPAGHQRQYGVLLVTIRQVQMRLHRKIFVLEPSALVDRGESDCETGPPRKYCGTGRDE